MLHGSAEERSDQQQQSSVSVSERETAPPAVRKHYTRLDDQHATGADDGWTVLSYCVCVCVSGGQSTQIKYLSKSTDTYNKILLQ